MSEASDQATTFYRIESSTIVQDEEIARLEREVFALIRGRPSIRLAIDFSRTYHVSSRALGLLVAFRKEAKKTEGRIVLFGINPAIQKVMEVTRLNTLIPIARDEAHAVEMLQDVAPA